MRSFLIQNMPFFALVFVGVGTWLMWFTFRPVDPIGETIHFWLFWLNSANLLGMGFWLWQILLRKWR